MKKRNGIGIFFVLGIATLVTIAVTRKDDPRKPSPFIMDTGSTFTRHGETYEDQMGVKSQTDSFTIPLTIVSAPVQGLERPPEVPKQANITLGEQRKENRFKNEDLKISIYERDIFIHYQEKMILDDFRFNLKPGLKNLTRMDELEELKILATTLEKRVFMRINDGALLETSSQLNNLVGFQNNPPDFDENVVLDLALQEGNKFNSKEKLKFTIELSFKCTKKMMARKSTYRISLEKVMMHTPDTTNKIDTDIDAVNDFFVIKCGE